MVQKLILVIFHQTKNYMKIIQLMTFRIKLQHFQNHRVLGSIK